MTTCSEGGGGVLGVPGEDGVPSASEDGEDRDGTEDVVGVEEEGGDAVEVVESGAEEEKGSGAVRDGAAVVLGVPAWE
nr:unnamed protein product [Digitaria exilis]